MSLICCFLPGDSAVFSTMAALPFGDAPGRDALSGTSVEAVHNRGSGLLFFLFSQKVDSLLSFFGGWT